MVTEANSRVTIVSVAFNSSEVLSQMLASVPTGTPTIVVDNNSNDLVRLRDLCSQHGATLIENAENLGFSAACNIGAKVAETEFLLFLNPDAVLFEDTLEKLVVAADRYRNASGLNPRLEDPAGKPFFKHGSKIIPRQLWLDRGWPAADCQVPILTGAALFVRRSIFDRIGGFDENIFLFFEDDDLSLRLAKHGPLMFIHDAQLVHGSGSTSGRALDIVALKAWHMGHSQVYAGRKHKLPFAFSRALFPALFKALLPDVLVRRAKRAKRWGFVKGVISAGFRSPSYLRLKDQ